jgi:hypothetical protein
MPESNCFATGMTNSAGSISIIESAWKSYNANLHLITSLLEL